MKQLMKMFHYLLLAVVFIALQGCDKPKKAEVQTVKIDDVELAYYTRGSGDPLIMIMGFRGTMANWDPGLLEILEKNYQLILFDNRGAGLSKGLNTDGLTISQMAEDTAKLIKALGFEKANVLGWSMGTRIGMELTFRHPELVETLILCAPNPGGKYQIKRESSVSAKLNSKELTKEQALALIFPDTPEGHAASAAYTTRLTEAVSNGSVPDDINVSEETVEQQAHALKLWGENNEAYEQLAKIKTPTLVAGGLKDILDDPENTRIVASRIPFAWSAYFPNAGHDFISQDHVQFARLLSVFIETNKSRLETERKGKPRN